MTTANQPGEIFAAIKAGYRIAPQPTFFPFEAIDPDKPGTTQTIHAVVDHGARSIFCSNEWFMKSRQGAV